MFQNLSRRALGVGLGGALILSASLALAYRALAQEQGRNGQRPGTAQAFQGGGGLGGQPGFPPGGGGGFGGGGFGGGGFGPGMMPGGGGGTMTATSTNVYVLRGNTLYSFDARTLKLTAQANLPQPEPGQGFPGGGGGFGGGGQGGFRQQGRPGGAPGGGDQN